MLLVSDSILGKLYTYTPDGIRSSKTVNGTKTEYLLNGTQILAQKTGSDVMWFFYDSTGTRIGVQQGNVTAYYMYNLQGDVVGLADAATGKIIAKYLYDAWGKCVSVENADGYTIGTANPFRYRGYYYDNDTGLYYLQSRYYDPAIGRFINADTYTTTDADGILSSNMFAYCENNPVVRSDATGEIFQALIVGAALGIAKQFALDVAGAMVSGRPLDDNFSSIGEYAAAAFSGMLYMIPGGGAMKTVVDIMGSSIIQESVNVVAQNRGANYKNVATTAAEGGASAGISTWATNKAEQIALNQKPKSSFGKKVNRFAVKTMRLIGKHASSILSIVKSWLK